MIELVQIRDKEMAHSIQSPAVDVFCLPSPKKTNLTVVPLSVSSGSFVRDGSPYVFPLSDPPIPPTHSHPPFKTRLMELANRGTTVEFVKKGWGREKRRLLDFLQSEPSPYLWYKLPMNSFV
jgi:hypothetical protein